MFYPAPISTPSSPSKRNNSPLWGSPGGTLTALPSHTIFASKILTTFHFFQEHRHDITLMAPSSSKEIHLTHSFRTYKYSQRNSQQRGYRGIRPTTWNSFGSWRVTSSLTQSRNSYWPSSTHNLKTQYLLCLWDAENNIFLIYKFVLSPCKLLFTNQPTLSGKTTTKGSRICPNCIMPNLRPSPHRDSTLETFSCFPKSLDHP